MNHAESSSHRFHHTQSLHAVADLWDHEDMGGIPHHSRSFQYACALSFCIHAIFLILATVEHSFYTRPTPQKIIIPTRVVVRTVSLSSPSQPSALSAKVHTQPDNRATTLHHVSSEKEVYEELVSRSSDQGQIDAPPEEKPHEPIHPQPYTEPTPKEPIQSSTQPIAVAPVEKKKKQPTQVQPKSSPKPASSTQKNNQTTSQKSSTQKKGKAPPPTTKKKSSSYSDIDDRQLQEALASLDDSSQYVSTTTTRAKGAAASAGSRSSTDVRSLGSLEADSSDFICAAGEENVHSSSPEGWYISDLIRRLQLYVRLQEPGIVRLLLTLRRDGTFVSSTIHESPSSATKKELQKALASIKYAPFGNCFSQESQHTFRLKLEDNGTWSS